MPDNDASRRGWFADLRRLPLAEFLVLIVAALYARSLAGGLLWDDKYLLSKDAERATALSDIWTGRHHIDYFPLSYTAFWAEEAVFGGKLYGYHAVNVALHAIATVLLWQCLKRLRVRGAWLGALIFAIHPVCVETVAWMAEQKNTLALTLYAATLLAYLRFDETPRVYLYCVALGSFVLSLLAKPAGVTLPFVLLLCAWWLRGRISKTDLLRSLPFLGASVGLGLITLHLQTVQLATAPVIPAGPLLQRAIGSGQFLLFYLGKAVFPDGLMTVYPPFPQPNILFDVLLIVAGVALWNLRSSAWARASCFAAGYYALTLAPVLGFFKMSFWVYSPVADRFQYFALPGIAALAGAAIVALPRNFAIPIGATVAVGLGVVTFSEQSHYRTEEILWRHQVAQTPESSIALSELGMVLNREKNFTDAKPYLQSAMAIQPDNATAHAEMGTTLLGLGNTRDAIVELEQAGRLDPNQSQIWNNLGVAYSYQHRPADAIEPLRKAIRLNPDAAEAHDNLGEVLVEMGQAEEGLKEIRIAISLDAMLPYADQHLQRALEAVKNKN